jgi:hypothetical protein
MPGRCRISAVYQAEKSRVDLYLLDHLGSEPGDLSGAKPITSTANGDGTALEAIDFKPQHARYMALQWTREEGEQEPF